MKSWIAFLCQSLLAYQSLAYLIPLERTDALSSEFSPDFFPGQVLLSPSRLVLFSAQTDGNVVLYANTGGAYRAIWSSGTFGRKVNRINLTPGGELDIISNENNAIIWRSITGPSAQPGPFNLTVQDDGNVVVYASNRAVIWATGTNMNS